MSRDPGYITEPRRVDHPRYQDTQKALKEVVGVFFDALQAVIKLHCSCYSDAAGHHRCPVCEACQIRSAKVHEILDNLAET